MIFGCILVVLEQFSIVLELFRCLSYSFRFLNEWSVVDVLSFFVCKYEKSIVINFQFDICIWESKCFFTLFCALLRFVIFFIVFGVVCVLFIFLLIFEWMECCRCSLFICLYIWKEFNYQVSFWYMHLEIKSASLLCFMHCWDLLHPWFRLWFLDYYCRKIE